MQSTEEALARIYGAALTTIRARHEVARGHNPLTYHNRMHACGVRNRAIHIVRAAGGSPHQEMLAGIAAMHHDIVLETGVTAPEDGYAMRTYQRGLNECMSAHEAVLAMRASGIEFCELDYGIVSLAIVGTIPQAVGPRGLTITQPIANAHTDLVVRAVALADLGEAAMHPEQYVIGAYGLFAELQVGITNQLRRKEYFFAEARKRLNTWLTGQLTYLEAREAVTEDELAFLPKEVEDLFMGFMQSRELIQNEIEFAQTSNDAELYKRFSEHLLMALSYPEIGADVA